MAKMICLKSENGRCAIWHNPDFKCDSATPHEYHDGCDIETDYCPKCMPVEEE
jgi:hypothetical protein